MLGFFDRDAGGGEQSDSERHLNNVLALLADAVLSPAIDSKLGRFSGVGGGETSETSSGRD